MAAASPPTSSATRPQSFGVSPLSSATTPENLDSPSFSTCSILTLVFSPLGPGGGLRCCGCWPGTRTEGAAAGAASCEVEASPCCCRSPSHTINFLAATCTLRPCGDATRSPAPCLLA